MSNQIIQGNKIAINQWLLINDANAANIPASQVIIPLALWNRDYQILIHRNILPGLLLNSDEDPAAFIGDIRSLTIIAINFPVFTDGRGFSIGNLLRERYAYRGELRAYGGFIRDQLYYLKRCGFDSFEFNNDTDLELARKSLNDFSNDYQASSNQNLPLFRRRATQA